MSSPAAKIEFVRGLKSNLRSSVLPLVVADRKEFAAGLFGAVGVGWFGPEMKARGLLTPLAVPPSKARPGGMFRLARTCAGVEPDKAAFSMTS
jgi:hypothetical protein